MRAIFLSDAHLKDPGDAVHEKLTRFFDRLRGRGGVGRGQAPLDSLAVDHLVIAGDFFDFWFGRGDTIHPAFRLMVERIAALKRDGVRISFCEGNHDFFLGDFFGERLGIEVYPEWADLEIDGRRMLVSHGDTVDRGNHRYLALRGFLRTPFVYHLQRLLPLRLLWGMARLGSRMSKEMSGESAERLVEIMHRFAQRKFREGYDAVILGHCHKPFVSEELCGGRRRTFATLGDWITHDSYLLYDDGRFTLNPPASAEPAVSGGVSGQE